MTELTPAPYPDDYKFNSVHYTNYDTKVIDFTGSDLLKNYPAESYSTFQNIVFDIPPNIEHNQSSIGGYTYSFHVTSGGNIQPYALSTTARWITNINQMKIMLDIHSLDARDCIRVDNVENIIDTSDPNNQFAVLFQNRNIIKNIKVYVTKQRMGFDPLSIEEVIKNGGKIIACENILPGQPLNIDVFNETLFYDEQLKIYFRVMFDLSFLAAAHRYFVNRQNHGYYEISHDRFVVDCCTVADTTVIIPSN